MWKSLPDPGSPLLQLLRQQTCSMALVAYGSEQARVDLGNKEEPKTMKRRRSIQESSHEER
jgi:hypothetical protein